MVVVIVCLFIYLSTYLSICLSACLSVYLQAWKPETSSILELDNVKNETIGRDFLNFWTWQHQKRNNSAKLSAALTASYQCVLRFFHSTCLKYCACHVRSAAPVTQNHLSKLEDLMLQNATPLRKRKTTSERPKVLRTRQFSTLLTSKCASRHNGVQFFISHLASWLRTRRFSEPTFRPSGATNHWKNTVFRGFPTFSRTWIFFLLRLSLFWYSFFFSSLLWLVPSLLFIWPYCRKFDF